MKLTVLTDNCAGSNFLAEHGLSYLIEHNNKYILFDTGYSDVFIKNAALLNINLQISIENIVLSHGHWDHGNGLRYLENKPLIAHPGAFIRRYQKNDKSYIGLAMDEEEIEKKYRLLKTKEAYELSNNIIFLGEIPLRNNFEAQVTPFIDENGKPDFVRDDSALVIIENNEISIATGCSHSGICNIVEHAKNITGINRIKILIGGFHLKFNNAQTKATINYLKEQNIKSIYPSHCTELPALSALHTELGTKQVKTGLVLHV